MPSSHLTDNPSAVQPRKYNGFECPLCHEDVTALVMPRQALTDGCVCPVMCRSCSEARYQQRTLSALDRAYERSILRELEHEARPEVAE